MKLKSYKQMSKLLINMEDKRDYLIKCDDINSKNLLKTIRVTDNIINQINLIYDDIIKDKLVDEDKLDYRFEKIIDAMKGILDND